MLSVSINRETYQPPSGGFLHCIVFILSHVVIEHIISHITLHLIILNVVQTWFVFLLFV